MLPEQSVTDQVRIICPVPQGVNPAVLSTGGPVVVVALASQPSLAFSGKAAGSGDPQLIVVLAGGAPVMTGGVTSETPGSLNPVQNILQVLKQCGPSICTPPVTVTHRLLLSNGLVQGPPEPLNSHPGGALPLTNLYW